MQEGRGCLGKGESQWEGMEGREVNHSAGCEHAVGTVG